MPRPDCRAIAARPDGAAACAADTYTKSDVLSIQESIVNHVEYTLARSRYRFDDLEAYLATAHSLRDRLIEVWNDTQSYFREQNGKRVYYLSMEFLMGRSLLNALFNLDVQDQYKEALLGLGYDLETVMSKVRTRFMTATREHAAVHSATRAGAPPLCRDFSTL